MAANKYDRVLHAFYSTPWAILPEKLTVLSSLLELRASGAHVSEEAAASAMSAARARTVSKPGAVAVIPIYGVIAPRMNMFTYYSGGTSVDQLTADYRAAVANEDVTAIVFDIDSPGGQVQGVPELAAEILANRGKKKTIAVASGLMASAAYYLGCCADEVVTSPSSLTGSIGVLMAHDDISEAMKAAGISETLIFAGKYKVEGNDLEPLGDEARTYFQSMIDETYADFVNTVAKARGVKSGDVRNGFGQGRCLHAKAAVEAGLCDRVATLDQVLSSFGATDPRKRSTSSQAGLSVSERIEVSRLPVNAAVPNKDADAVEPGCECPCQPCKNGDCEGCTQEECDFDGCACHDEDEDDAEDGSAAARSRELEMLSL